MRQKLKDFLEDTQVHKKLLQEQKKYNAMYSEHNRTKNRTPVRRIMKLDLKQLQKGELKNIVHSKDKQRSRTIDTEVLTQSKALLKDANEISSHQKRKMVDLKLNYMVCDLNERLGFVTKKQKMDHMISLMAKEISKQYKNEQKSLSNAGNSQELKEINLDSGEYDMHHQQQIHNYQTPFSDNESKVLVDNPTRETSNYFETKRNSYEKQINQQKWNTAANFYSNNAKKSLKVQSRYQDNISHTPYFMQKDSKYSTDQKFSKNFDTSQQQSSVYDQSKDMLLNILAKEPYTAKNNQGNETITIQIGEQTKDDYINQGIVMDFLNSLYSDQDWTKIASDSQFKRILNLVSEYFGMDHTYENKYNNLPRFQLAKQEIQKINNQDDANHIASDRKHHRNNSKDPADEFLDKKQKEFENLLRQCDLDSTIMKEKFVLQRYAKYLNKCMFIAQDDFIKKKFKAFLNKGTVKKSENFFQRMQKDQDKRKEKEKIMQEYLEKKNLPVSHIDKLSNTMESSNDTHNYGLVNRLGQKIQKDIGKQLQKGYQNYIPLTRDKSGEGTVTSNGAVADANDEFFFNLRKKSSSSYVPLYQSANHRKNLLNPIQSDSSLESNQSFRKMKLLNLKNIKSVSKGTTGGQVIDQKIQSLQQKVSARKNSHWHSKDRIIEYKN